MRMFRRVLLATAAFLSGAVPAVAQTATATTDTGGGSLIYVWVWILVVGVAAMIIGTSIGVGKRR